MDQNKLKSEMGGFKYKDQDISSYVFRRLNQLKSRFLMKKESTKAIKRTHQGDFRNIYICLLTSFDTLLCRQAQVLVSAYELPYADSKVHELDGPLLYHA